MPIKPPRTAETMTAFLMDKVAKYTPSDREKAEIAYAAEVFIKEKIPFERIKDLKYPHRINELRVDVEREKRNGQSHKKGYYER